MASRAICIALLATFAVLSSAAPLHESTPDTVVPETALVAATPVDVLENIIQLKSYCLAAYDEARILLNAHHNNQAITEFVALYGQHGQGKSDVEGLQHHVENIVTEYSHIMGVLHAKYGTGVNKYVLDQMDENIRTNPKGVIYHKHDMEAFGNGGVNGRKYGDLAALNYHTLGLTSLPNVVVKLSVSTSRYLVKKTHTAHTAENADAVAASVFLQSKAHGQYKSFLQTEINKVQKKMREEYNVIVEAAKDAAHNAFEKSYEADRKAFFKHVRVQAPAANSAANKMAGTIDWVPPTLAELKKIAQKKAHEFMEKFKADTPVSEIVKTIAADATGVKLTIVTSGATDAGSTMKPTIKFIGTQNSLEGEIRSVGPQGQVAIQHFPTDKALGEITSIVLDGEGTDLSWACSELHIRSGDQNAPSRRFKAQGTPDNVHSFELKSGDSITLVADSQAKATRTTATCVGFEATRGCTAKGQRERENDRGCDEEIDSTYAGSCNCGAGGANIGPRDCGQATVTCTEICNTITRPAQDQSK